MKKNIFVSIIIPVYNGSNYLSEAIESALAQSYSHIEIIIVNDGSDDEGKTEAIARSFGDKIKYFYKKNGGVSSALNFGIAHMSGDYFSWLSHDDLYAPNKIERQVAAIETDRDIILCSGLLMDAQKNIIRHKTKLLSGRYSGRELFQKTIDGYNLNGLGFLIPKTILDEVGGFNVNMKYIQDFDCWLRIMQLREDIRFICLPQNWYTAGFIKIR